jgi:hypothetical protein
MGSEIDAAGADSSFHCFGITEDKKKEGSKTWCYRF